MPDPLTYYAAWITNTASRDRGSSWCWSPPYSHHSEAVAKLHEMQTEGTLIVGFVVSRDAAGKRKIHLNRTVPGAARKAIERWIELREMIADG